MKLAIALCIGIGFVAVVAIVGHRQAVTPIPFLLLLPGILAGALAPDSGFNPEGDVHLWGHVSTLIVYAVNTGIYSCIAYLVLHLIQRARKIST